MKAYHWIKHNNRSLKAYRCSIQINELHLNKGAVLCKHSNLLVEVGTTAAQKRCAIVTTLCCP